MEPATARPAGIDPTVFNPENVDPETAAFNEQLEKTLSEFPPLHTLEPQILREAQEQGLGPYAAIQVAENARNQSIPGPDGPVTVRVHVPDTVKGVYLHFHGGGFVLGKPVLNDPAMDRLAHDCDVAVVSVDYRLAPEHPYPAGPDDCEAAALWLVENTVKEFGTDRLLIGGESAGANLSVVTLVRMRDKHGFTGFSGANLVYGVFDLSMTPSSKNWGMRPLLINTPLMEYFNNHYTKPDLLRHPDVSPLYADLKGLPPALFTVGTQDPLLDDSLFMHARWISAGNQGELAVYPGACHGFNGFPLKVAEAANQRIKDFVFGLVNHEEK
jgi:acetyl esterase